MSENRDEKAEVDVPQKTEEKVVDAVKTSNAEESTESEIKAGSGSAEQGADNPTNNAEEGKPEEAANKEDDKEEGVDKTVNEIEMEKGSTELEEGKLKDGGEPTAEDKNDANEGSQLAEGAEKEEESKTENSKPNAESNVEGVDNEKSNSKEDGEISTNEEAEIKRNSDEVENEVVTSDGDETKNEQDTSNDVPQVEKAEKDVVEVKEGEKDAVEVKGEKDVMEVKEGEKDVVEVEESEKDVVEVKECEKDVVQVKEAEKDVLQVGEPEKNVVKEDEKDVVEVKEPEKESTKEQEGEATDAQPSNEIKQNEPAIVTTNNENDVDKIVEQTATLQATDNGVEKAEAEKNETEPDVGVEGKGESNLDGNEGNAAMSAEAPSGESNPVKEERVKSNIVDSNGKNAEENGKEDVSQEGTIPEVKEKELDNDLKESEEPSQKPEPDTEGQKPEIEGQKVDTGQQNVAGEEQEGNSMVENKIDENGDEVFTVQTQSKSAKKERRSSKTSSGRSHRRSSRNEKRSSSQETNEDALPNRKGEENAHFQGNSDSQGRDIKQKAPLWRRNSKEELDRELNNTSPKTKPDLKYPINTDKNAVNKNYLTRQVKEGRESEQYLRQKLDQKDHELEAAERKVNDLQLRLKRFVKDDKAKDDRILLMEKELKELTDKFSTLSEMVDQNANSTQPTQQVGNGTVHTQRNSKSCVIL